MTSWCVEPPRRPRRLSLPKVNGATIITLLLLWWSVGGPWPNHRSYGHVPVPESVLDPRSAPEAWNVLRLASANIERLLREDRLAEVPDQASLCPPSLRLLARLAEPTTKRQATAIGTVRAGSALNSLAQACVAGDHPGAEAALKKLRAALDALVADEDVGIVRADVYYCPMHPEVSSVTPGSSCPRCGMPLVARRIPYSFVYAAPTGESSMTMTVSSDHEPIAGRSLQVKIHLSRRDGQPVTPGDLLTVHTQRVHLLIIDPSLEDYHHEHPTPTDVPGEYEFTFTPQKTSSYRIFADVTPAMTGIQEYIAEDMPSEHPAGEFDDAPIRRETCMETGASGLRFRLTVGEVPGAILHAGQSQVLHLSVADEHGQPCNRLEPVMNAFAHLVGFYDDGRTVVHLQPAGPEVVDDTATGGPALEFRFYPPKGGFLRLYCQVSVGRAMVYAPFGVYVVR